MSFHSDASTFVDLLQARAAAAPERPAYTFLADGEVEADRLSYGELDTWARRIAAGLLAEEGEGVAGERALLLFPPGLEFAAAFLGCLYAGVVAVPAYPPRPGRKGAGRLEAIAADARPRLALTTAAIAARWDGLAAGSEALGAVRCREILERGERGPAEPDGIELPRVGPEDLAFLQYTSGSTSTPKGVEVRHRHLLFMERLIGEVFEQGPESVVVGWLPLYHDMGLIGNLLQPLAVGGHCVLMAPVAFLRRPRRWLEAISRYRATTSGGPSFAYELCAARIGPEERAGLDLSSWRVAFNGAEPVRAATLARFAEAFAPAGFRSAAFQPCYGLAEATLLVSGVRGGSGPRVLSVRAEGLERGQVETLEALETAEPGPRDARTVELVGCGGVPPSVRVEIVDPVTLRRAGSGEVGEVWVAGPLVTAGYWGRPEETERDFAARIDGDEAAGPHLRTGDLGFLADGELFITGRLKDLIILRGRNLYPQDLEWTAERSAPELAVAGAAAFSVERDGEERLVVAVEVAPRVRLDAALTERLAAAVRRAVAEEHEAAVDEVVLLAPGGLPKTSSGKVQRRECRRRYLDGALEAVGRSRLEAAEAGEAEALLTREGLLALPADERSPALARELRARAAAALGLAVGELGLDQPLLDLGLDSLAAIDLAHGIGRDFGIELPLEALFEGASCERLAVVLVGGLEGPAEAPDESEGEGWTGLSYGERALWLLDRVLPPEDASYRLAAVARVAAGSVPTLRTALQALVDRHEALRTTYAVDPETGEPVRQVAPVAEVAFEEHDATGWTPERLRREIEREAWSPYDLAEGPLFRAALFTGVEPAPVLVVAVHHIVADFPSLALLARELGEGGGALSRAAGEGRGGGYSTFAHRQTRELAGPRGEELWGWWRERLAHLPAAPALPYDRAPEPGEPMSGQAGTVRLDLGPERTAALQTLARRQGVTLYAALLGLQAALLARLTGEADLTIGAPAAGRPAGWAAAAETVGYFVNPLILRLGLERDPAFTAILAQARERLTGALAHQDLPLPLLVERLRREPGAPSDIEPFRTMLTLYQAPAGLEGLVPLTLGEAGGPGGPGDLLRLGPFELEPLPLAPRSSQFDLTLSFGMRGGSLGGLLVYHTGRFDAPTMGRLAAQLETLLDGALARPEARLSELPLLSAPARHQLVFEANDRPDGAPGWTSLEEGFERQAREAPERTALVSGEARISYAELNRRANQLAHLLIRLGVKVEDRVGVRLGRTPEMVAALLGVLKAGAAYVPLDPALPQERLSFLLEDSGASLLIDREFLDTHAENLANESGDDPPRRFDRRGTLAYVIYTSGSTGRPKGVGIEHGSALHLIGWAGQTYGDAELSGVLASTSIGFDLSIFELFAPLSFGGMVILADNALALPALPAAAAVTLLNTVPSAMAALLELGALPPALQTVNLAGEPLRRGLAEKVFEAGVPRLYNLYGPSEDTTYSTGWRIEPGEPGEPPIGRPLAGSRAYVVDAALQLLPPGAAGELWLGGFSLARGYLGRPELTAERFVPDPWSGEAGVRLYRTGDRVRQRADGALLYLGRLDRQLKIRGYRIEPGEIEAALLARPEVREAAVVRRAGQDALAAFVVLDGEAPAGIETELLAGLARRLPAPLVPSLINRLEALPLTPNGKVDRKALENLSIGAEPAIAAPPAGEVEERLAAIWAELLDLDGTPAVGAIGRDSRFFDLGGHSLLAARLVARVRQAFGVDLPLSVAFEAPRLWQQARRIEEGRRQETAPIPQVESVGPQRLSFAQERLWFLDQLAPGKAVYNMPVAQWLAGSLDVPALAAALTALANRHDALRTSFAVADGTPYALVGPPIETFSLPVVDLNDREEALRFAAAEAERPFDLGSGPLFRAALVRLGGTEEHLLVLVLHHIVADGWSLDVLGRELGALYGGEALPALPIQYADYAAWQRATLTDAALAAELDAWTARLEGLPPALSLPGDRPRPPVQSFQGGTASLALASGLRDGLGALAARSGATPFLVWLAGFSALLSRLTGETDLGVGTAVANRTRVETEGLIGLFVNSLVVRGDLSGDPAFETFLSWTRDTALWAFAHQDLPFEKLVERLAPVRALSHAPLFQVMLVAEVAAPAVRLQGLDVRRQPLATGTAKLDLLLTLAADGGSCELEYNRDLFDPSTAQRLLGQLETLLASAVAAPDQRLAELPFLPEAERQQILVEWNAIPRPARGAETLPERFAEQARRTPDAVAVIHGTDRVSYRELARRAEAITARLIDQGIGPEMRVGILLPRTPDMIAALLGILGAGGAYLPLDPKQPAARLEWTLEDAGAALLITSPELGFSLAEPVGLTSTRLGPPASSRQLIFIGRQDAGGPSRGISERSVGRNALAYIIYTSGSTGRPKGVAIEHRSAAALLDWGAERFSSEELAGVLATTSISFDLSVFEIFLPLTTGGTVILARDALELPSLPAAPQVTLVNTVPSALAEILRMGGLPPAVRTVNLAGEPLPAPLAAEIYAQPRVERVWNLYGPSEDTTYSTGSLVPRPRSQSIAQPAIGRPLPGTQAHVLDAAFQPLPLGVPGELLLGGDGLARGYLGRPDLTAARFVPNSFGPPGSRLYRTGDLARFRTDGELDFLGRLDHQVKLRGFRIELGEIEAVLAEHPAVRAAAVLVEERASGARLVACWAPRQPDEEADPAALRAHLRERLPEPMVPAAFLRLPALPLTPNGKIDRKALAGVIGQESGLVTARGGEAPRTATEERIAAIWREVLGTDQIDTAASFFEIGGHSLLATRVMSRLRGVFGIDLPVRILFEAPSVRDLARRVEAALATARGTEERPPLGPRAVAGPPPLSFAQERLWFLDRLGAGAVYNIPVGLTLRGALDPDRLAAALTAVARRHEALRTTFETDGSGRQAVQVIAPAATVAIALPWIDLSALPPGRKSEEARRLGTAESEKPFDLTRGPLLRAALLRLADHEHALLLDLHHIVADGWSLGVLVTEVAAFYRGETLPELPIQYADFAVWQREWLDEAETARQVAFWRESLLGAPRSLALPIDRPRPAAPSYRGDALPFVLGPGLAAGLTALGQRAGATPFMVLLAGFAVLLQRATGQGDFVIGTPIANRNLVETENLIGLFVNSLALRVDLRGDASLTVAGLVDRARETALAAYAHQDLPFERLVEALRPERRLAQNPIFQVMFALQNAPLARLSEIDLPGLALEPFPFSNPTAKLDLQLDLTEAETADGKVFHGELRYAADLFDRSTAERLIEWFSILLEAVAADPERRLEELPLLGEGARYQTVFDASAEPLDGPRPEYIPPRTPEEAALAEIWAEVLELPAGDRAGVADRFFALGGHSLLATQVVARVRERFGVELPLRTVFEEATLADLAGRIEIERRALSIGLAGLEAGPAVVLPPLERAPRDGSPFRPASFAQRRLWFLDRLEPGTALYNIPAALAVRGNLDVPTLAAVLTEIARRHEALRTVFAEEGGEPVQRVLDPAPVPVPVVDLAALPADRREAAVRTLVDAEAGTAFDLAYGPLWRVRLLRLDEREHRALLTLHHIVSDGWSMEVLVREVAALYAGVPLPELPVQYGDYAVWQRSWLAGPPLEMEIAYWRRQLDGVPPLELPTDRPRPAVATNRGALLAWELPADLATGLRALARRQGATLFSTLLAGFQALLLRLSGQDDLSVGTPVAGRSHVELEGLVGFFVNTLVLRVRPAGDPPFRDLLARAREAALAAQAHQAVPFDRLVEELAPERSLSRTPLFQAMFALQTGALGSVELPGLTLEALPQDRPAGDTAKFDLTLTIEEGADGLAASFEYATDLFDRATIERWAGHLERLLADAVEGPSRRLSELPLLSEAERRQIAAWGDSHEAAEPPAAAFYELFALQAESTPEAVAVEGLGERWSYRELRERAERLAARLRAEGIGPEAAVAVCAERSPALITGLLGTLAAGGVYLPVDSQLPVARRDLLLADAGARAVLVTERVRAGWEVPAGVAVVELEKDLKDSKDAKDAKDSRKSLESFEPFRSFEALPGHLAYLIYTSGSSGRPKGVAVSHEAAVRQCHAAIRVYGLTAADRVLQFAAPGFDVSLEEILPTLACGAALVIAGTEPPHPADLLAETARHRITVLNLPTAYWQQWAREGADLVRAGRPAPSPLRAVIVGGESMSPAAVPAWEALREAAFPAVLALNSYGPTETVITATWHEVGPGDAAAGSSVSLGHLMPGRSAWVVDRQGALQPAGVPGELRLGGILARGYLGDPARTAECFVPDPFGPPGGRLYRTGDLVRWTPAGELSFLGRIDHQVKVRGFRVELGEIETALAGIPGVREAVAVVHGEGEERRLAAFYVPEPGVQLDPAALREPLRERLPAPLVPAVFVPLPALPLTPNGKVDRRALPDPFAGEAAPRDESRRPRTPVEEVVAAIWCDVLELPAAGLGESFFDLGGHSLLATRVGSRLRAAFGVELPLRDLFEQPTIEGLAARVEAARLAAAGEGGPAPGPPIERAPRDRPLPLSFAQQRLWFLDQMESGGAAGAAAYNIPFAVRLDGPLRPALLAAALTEIVRRHEALRTRFVAGVGDPVQVIDSIDALGPFPLPLIDLTALSETGSEVRRLAAALDPLPFDLARGPVLRGFLLRLAPARHVLLAGMHHIVSDEWSLRILLRELSVLYRAFGSGMPSPLPPLPVQYADFAVWQRRWLEGDALATQLAFWRERLGDEPPVLELPADRPRPAVQSYRGDVLPQRLPDALARALLQLSRRASATPFMTLLAAFAALLARATGQTDLAIGSPITGRNRLEVEEVIGFFLNTLVLRIDLSSDPSFAGLLAQVRERSLAAYAHQDLPFEKLVDELKPRRSLAHSPLFQALFVLLHEAPLDEEIAPGLRIASLPSEQKTAKFDLSLALSAEPGSLSGSWEYATDLFDRTTVARLAGHFERLLAALAEDPDRPVSQVPLASPAEVQQILWEWNDTGGGEPHLGPLGLVHEVFAARARLHPDRDAVVWEGGSWTYAELDRHAGQLAARLRALGVGPDVPVAVLAERGPRLAAALLGALKAGGAYLPLDPAFPAERLRFMLEDSGAPVLLRQGNSAAPPSPARHEIDLQSFDWSGPTLAAVPVDIDHISYVIYTSGSTGRPKGSALPHRTLTNLIGWQIDRLAAAGVDPALRTLQFASPSFDVTFQETFATWCAGGAMVVVPEEARRDPRLLVEVLVRERVERLYQPFVALQQLAEQLAGMAPGEPLPERLREVITSGERLQITPQIAALPRLLPGSILRNQYGPSETHVVTEHALAGDSGRWPLLPPIGRPVARTAVYLIDRGGLPVPAGVAGELLLGGANLARGYLGRPGLTAEKFVPDPFSGEAGSRLYRSGDLARYRADGEIEFLGRADHQLKIRGFRIEPGEIEVALTAHPQVREAVVVAREGAAGRRLVAYVVPAEGESLEALSSQDLRTFLRDRLPEYMVPAAFVTLAAFPLTGSGKVQRSALPEPEESRAVPYVPPATALEGLVAEVVAAQLGVRQVGRDDNFFDAGAHSLLLVRVAGELGRRLGRKVAVVDLFRFPTVSSLAAFLGEGPAAEAPPDRSVFAARAEERARRRPHRTRREEEMAHEPTPPPVPAPAPVKPEPIGSKPDSSADSIAIVGLACRYPGADDPAQLWKNLRDGVESITFFTDEELAAAGVPPEQSADPAYVRAGGVLDRPEYFDADFFGFTPREAELMDPQHRLLLECAWEACENAGYVPDSYPGRIGVYAGAASGTYFVHNVLTNPEVFAAAGGMQVKLFNDKDFLTTHISYRLNLRGPSMAVQTACSTSLVAVHVAAQALLNGECDMALAGGSGIGFPHRAGTLYQEGGINSPDGHCRAFDIRAQGLVGGNGVGVVLLKRLGDALRDGDFIHAVIRGTAVNNDGSLKAGYTAPSVESQTEVIGEALAAAGVDADTLGLVEAHGSGTPLGDPIEVRALTRAFRATTDRRGYCALGSIKTNIGHTDAAAGVAGLMKAVLALENRQIPPSLHFEEPNPELDLPESPFFVPTRALDWPKGPAPRRAGVSSLGIGGTNAHVVLEEAPAPPVAAPSRPWQLLVLSARTPTALDSAAARLAGHLSETPLTRFELADVAHTLRVGRKAFPFRRALLCRDRNEAAAALTGAPGGWIEGTAPASGARPVAFLFPGLGEHYAGMAAGLYRAEPVFRAAIDRSAELLGPHLGVDLRELLLYFEGGYPAFDRAPKAGGSGGGQPDLRRLLAAEPEEDAEGSELGRTVFAHPAVFAVEHALAELWMAWGIRPRAMIGYSLGEYVAACLAGVFSLEDALTLVAGRARLVDALPAGAMLAVPLPAAEVETLLSGSGLDIAATNGPGLTVVAGPSAAADAFAQRLAGGGVACRRLRTQHAFHSAMMRPAAAELTRLAAGIDLKPPRIPFVSNLTGTWITDAQATDPAYWGEHLAGAVRFAPGLETLTATAPGDEPPVLLEVGPGQTLGTLARQRVGRPAGEAVVSTLRDRREEVSDQAFLLDALARLWAAGATPDWAAFAGNERRRRRPLPTYPFERRRFFLEPGKAAAALPEARAAEPGSDRRELKDWFYAPAWERVPKRVAEEPRTEPLRWLLLGEGGSLADRLSERLAAAGEFFERVESPGDYRALLQRMRESGGLPQRIVHLLSLDSEDAAEEKGFYNLLALAQALAETDPESRAGLHLGVVTRGVADVLGEESLVPERATLLGPCRVLPQEVPGVTCNVIDLAAADLGPLADLLLEELSEPRPAPLVALRGRRRFVRRFRPVELPSAERGAARLRQGGVYLITGGLDETGVVLAEQLHRACGAKLILVAPEDTPPLHRWGEWLSALDEDSDESRRLRRVLALERSGCDLAVTPADLAHPGQVREAVELALSRFGPLHGVIHAAGKSGAGLLQWKTRAQAAAVLAPKVTGTRNLAKALEGSLKDKPLDFFLLFGSNTAVTGGLGQADTAAAAAFLDAFAEAAEGRSGLPVQTLDWGYFRWQAVTAATPEMAAALEAGLAVYGITADELFETFLRALAAPLPQIAVSTQDLDDLTAQLDALSASSLLEEIGRPAAAPAHVRPDLPVAYEPPRGEIEETIARLWQDAFGIEAIGRDDNFFDLSGNSLLAIQIVTRISQALEVDLSTASLLEAPTVAGLAQEVERLRGARSGAPEEDLAAIDPAELERLLREIETLSPDEAEAKLARELEAMS